MALLMISASLAAGLAFVSSAKALMLAAMARTAVDNCTRNLFMALPFVVS
jgi:hypothetical protein